jgi:hypothetical protein
MLNASSASSKSGKIVIRGGTLRIDTSTLQQGWQWAMGGDIDVRVTGKVTILSKPGFTLFSNRHIR